MSCCVCFELYFSIRLNSKCTSVSVLCVYSEQVIDRCTMFYGVEDILSHFQ